MGAACRLQKIKGRKRHIVVDTIGLMVGLVVHTADILDRDGAPAVLSSIRRACPWLRHIFADGGCQGPKLLGALKRIGQWNLEIVKRPIPQRASRFCPADGSSSEHLHGSGDAEDWQRSGTNPSHQPKHGSMSLISASQQDTSQGIAMYS